MGLLKSKTFIGGLCAAVTGSVLCIIGQPAVGATLLVTGLTTMLGRNATEKVKKQLDDVKHTIEQASNQQGDVNK